jgi:hypothetical protein
LKKQRGTVLFPNITSFPIYNGAPSTKYELTITLNDEQVADGETNELSYSTSEYQGNPQHKAKFKTKWKPTGDKVVDKYKKPFVDDTGTVREIPKGSEVIVYYTQRPYEMMGRKGVTNDLRAIQVLEESSGVDFEDFSEELSEEDVNEF